MRRNSLTPAHRHLFATTLAAVLTSFASWACVEVALDSPDEVSTEQATPSRPLLTDSPSAAVGPFTGAFSVSLDGAATYQLPLDFAPGRGGFGPKLALTYSSRSGVGAAGVGWRVSGLSAVYRCPRIVALHGVAAPVRYDDNDAFCYDGEYLIRVSSTPGNGGSETVEFVKERNDNTRIRGILHGSGSSRDFVWWTVDHPNGHRMVLGEDGNLSKVFGPAGKAQAWLLGRFYDRYQNYWQVSYRAPWSPVPLLSPTQSTVPEYLVESIRYTGRDGVQQLSPGREIKFVYTANARARLGFVHGDRSNQTEHLTRIDGYILDDPEYVGKPERSYRLQQQESAETGRNLLTRVDRCDREDVCLPALSFGYGPGGDYPGVEAIEPQGADSEGPWMRVLAADINGDGLDDTIRITKFDDSYHFEMRLSSLDAAGSWSLGPRVYAVPFQHEDWHDFLPVDVDLDGRTEILGFTDEGVVRVLRFMSASSIAVTTHSGAFELGRNTRAGDLTGDGYPDLVGLADGCMVIRVNQNGTTWSPGQKMQGICIGDSVTPDSPDDDAEQVQIADIDGDGMLDAILGKVAVSYQGQHLSTTSLSERWTGAAADINGDGLVDAVPTTGDSAWFPLARPKPSTGRGLLLHRFTVAPMSNRPSFLVDVNLDGTVDAIAGAGDMSLLVMRDWDLPAPVSQLRVTPTIRNTQAQYNRLHTQGDLDGDGVSDLILYEQRWNQYKVSLFPQRAADLLSTMAVGSSTVAASVVRYGALPRATIEGAAACVDTTHSGCVRGGPMRVVREVESDAGPGHSARRVRYSYAGGRRDRGGRGFLGFERVRLDSDADATTEDITLSLDEESIDPVTGRGWRYPHRGRVVSRDRRVSLDHRDRTKFVHTQEYGRVAHPTGAYTPYLRRATSSRYDGRKSYDVSGAWEQRTQWTTVEHNDFDTYGYPRFTREDHGDGVEQATELRYAHSASPWLIGRIRVRTTTASALGKPDIISNDRWVFGPRGEVETWTHGGGSDGLGLDRLETHYELNEHGLLRQLTEVDAYGESRRTILTYNDPSELGPTTVTNPAGHQTHFVYHPSWAEPRRITNANGELIDVARDGFGRITRTMGPDGNSATSTWAASNLGPWGWMITNQTPGTPPVAVRFDRLGRPIDQTWIGFSGARMNERTSYDRLGRAVVTHGPAPAGATTDIPSRSTTFDNLGRTQTWADESNATWTVSYTGGPNGGLKTVETDPHQRTTTRTFGPRGELLQVDSNGTSIHYEHDALGRMSAMVDPLGERTTIERNADGLVTRLSDPTTGVEVTTYSAFGEPVHVTNSVGASTMKYDALGRLTRHSGPHEATEYTWDVNPTVCPPNDLACGAAQHTVGRRVLAISPDGHRRSDSYDTFGRTSATTFTVDGQKLDYTYEYDPYGRVAKLWYPETSDGFTLGIEHEYTNGVLGRLKSATSGYVFWQRLSTDAAGRTRESAFGDLSREVRGYDTVGRTTSITTRNGSVLRDMAYDYDYSGNLIGRRDLRQSMTERFMYDGPERLSESCFLAGTSPIQPPSPPPPQSPSGQQFAVVAPIPLGAPPPPPPSPAGQAAGTWSLVPLEEARVLRAANSVSHSEARLPGQAAYRACTNYYYDAIGNLTERTDLGSYKYPATTPGGRTLRHAPYQVLATMGPITISYDDAGRTTRLGSDTFQYDEQSRLRSATIHGLDTAYTYMADGERATASNLVSRTVYAGRLFAQVETQPSTLAQLRRPYSSRQRVATYTVMSDEGPVAEVTHFVEPVQWQVSNQAVWPWVNTSGQDRSLLPSGYDSASTKTWAQTSAVYYIHRDPLGSVEMVTDRSGAVVERRSYSPFGSPRSPDWATGRAPVAASERRVGFTGHEDDAQMGLVNMQGRVYHPVFGRFLTPDPLVQAPDRASSLTRYAYVWNNPLRWVDPTGFQAEGESGQCVDNCELNGSKVDAKPTPTPAPTPPSEEPREMPRASVSWTDIGAPGSSTIDDPGLSTRPARDDLRVPYQGFVQTWLEPIFPPLRLLDENRAPTSPLQRTRLMQDGLAELATSWIPISKAPKAIRIASMMPEAPVRYQINGLKAAVSSIYRLLAPVTVHRHHVFPQKFRKFFESRGINIDDFTVKVSEGHHLRSLHGRGDALTPGRYNEKWAEFINVNPQATAREIYQFGGKMMDDFGLSSLPLVPYR